MSMSRNNPTGAIISILAGIIIFVVFGFVFFIPSIGFFPMISIFPSFFIIVFIVLIAVVSSNNRSQKTNKTFKNENQVNIQKANPYRIDNKSQNNIKTTQYQWADEEIELKPIIKFCQFCGTKIEKNAIFCHSCGSKIE
ncbi:MAG: zinc ribbon domain-containing protein [Promethearchaeota archaeon]